ncbi:MAG: ribosome-associated translation inhibitor RaiA [Marinilabiliales bacterium]
MSIKIHSVQFKADKKLEEFIENKINKLIKRHENIIGAEVFLKLDNNSTLENKIAEIKIEIPGNDLFAKKQSKSFEASTDIAIEALRRQLKKHKEKLRGR